MKKSMKAGALLVAGVFALSGCGSSSEAADSGSTESSPTPTPTLAVGQDQYTADELEAALTAVKTARGLEGDVENDAALRPQLGEVSLSGITATPAQCVTLVSSLFDETIADGNLATVELGGTGGLMLISYKDSSVPDKQAETGEQLAGDCAEFQMEKGGVTITGAVEPLDASTEAPTTQAYRTTITRADGQAETVLVQALSGTLNLSVTVLDPADAAAAVATAEETINAALAELEKK